jgi:hypothetical protein
MWQSTAYYIVFTPVLTGSKIACLCKEIVKLKSLAPAAADGAPD